MISGTFLFISPELMQTAQKVKMQIVIQTYEKSEETQKQHQEESALYQKWLPTIRQFIVSSRKDSTI